MCGRCPAPGMRGVGDGLWGTGKRVQGGETGHREWGVGCRLQAARESFFSRLTLNPTPTPSTVRTVARTMCAMHPVCCAAHASRQGVGGERARKAKISGRPFALTGTLARCVMRRHQGSWQRASTPSSSNLVLCSLEVTCPPRSGCCLPAWPLCGFDLASAAPPAVPRPPTTMP